jgi:hypothetical protein
MSHPGDTLTTPAEPDPAPSKEPTMTLMTAQAALPATLLSAQEHLGFELGWDHAHHAVTPPAPYADEPTSLRAGLLAGRAVFGARALPASNPVRMWLQLRLFAWLRGLSVETVQVTPRYLEQLVVPHCPITRAPLSGTSVLSNESAITRVRHDAGYAAGNLAVMSAKASAAKGTQGHRDALRLSRQLDTGMQSGIAGLNAAQWARLAILGSFVEPMPHAQACALPLLVLPPNRLRLFNPAQALQAFISRQLLAPGWSLRVSRIEALVPGKAARHAFQTFFHALLPRVLEAGRNISAHELRWAIEDAWRHPLVQQRWSLFALQLSAQQCEALVLRAHAKRLGQGVLHEVNDTLATEGWNIESQGCTEGVVAHATVRRRPRPQRHQQVIAPSWQLKRQASLPLH